MTNHSIDITFWQTYFAQVVVDVLAYSLKLANIIVEKAKFYRRIEHLLNERQKIAIDRVLRDSLDSFPLGLNAKKYIRITRTSRATATRDLQDLVENDVVNRTGERKATRYSLNLPKGS